MTTFRTRVDARLLPSRYRFALFRLLAFARLVRSSQVTPRADLLFIDRDQSSTEQYTVAIWMTLTVAALCGGLLAGVWPAPAAAILAIPMAMLFMHLPVPIGKIALPLWERLTGRPLDRIRANSKVVALLITALAAIGLSSSSWIRYVAWQYFSIVVANGIAALVFWSVRRKVRTLEAEYGVTS